MSWDFSGASNTSQLLHIIRCPIILFLWWQWSFYLDSPFLMWWTLASNCLTLAMGKEHQGPHCSCSCLPEWHWEPNCTFTADSLTAAEVPCYHSPANFSFCVVCSIKLKYTWETFVFCVKDVYWYTPLGNFCDFLLTDRVIDCFESWGSFVKSRMGEITWRFIHNLKGCGLCGVLEALKWWLILCIISIRKEFFI